MIINKITNGNTTTAKVWKHTKESDCITITGPTISIQNILSLLSDDILHEQDSKQERIDKKNI